MLVESLRARLLLLLGVGLAGAGCGPIDEGVETEEITQKIAARGTTTPDSGEVLLCAEPAFAGTCELVKSNRRPLMFASTRLTGLRERALSSLKVGEGVKVTLCSQQSFAGTCETFDPGNHDSLIEHQIGDNAAASVRIEPLARDCRNSDPPGNQVYLYRLPDYGGDCVAANHNKFATNAISMGIGDNLVSSVKVGPSSSGVVLFDLPGGGGPGLYLEAGRMAPNLGTLGFDDRTSSLWALPEPTPAP